MKLTAKARDKLKPRQFGVVRKDGEEKFPMPDKSHARNALARLNQSDLSASEKREVLRKAESVLGHKTKSIRDRLHESKGMEKEERHKRKDRKDESKGMERMERRKKEDRRHERKGMEKMEHRRKEDRMHERKGMEKRMARKGMKHVKGFQGGERSDEACSNRAKMSIFRKFKGLD